MRSISRHSYARGSWSLATTLGLTLAAATACADRPVRGDAPNQLSSAQKKAGWKLLFDGQSLTGWHTYRKPGAAPTNWAVKDGTLAWTAKGGDLASDDDYESFELTYDWKIAPGGNSGVMFHVTEDHPNPWETGPEMQILDNAGHPDGKNPLTSAGAAYALYPAPPDAAHPVGEWNEARLIVKGAHVEQWLNGKKLLSYELGSPEWTQKVAASKFASMPDYGRRKTGRLVFQDHSSEVWFRNIKVRRLP